MTSRYKKAIIEDIASHGIEAAEQSHLLDIFEYAMKSIAITLAREARFETIDFASANERGCEGFGLLLRRTRSACRDVWYGEFTRGEQRLSVIASLE